MQQYLPLVHLLEAVQEHRPVLLVQDRLAHLDQVVRPYGQEVPIAGGVVQLHSENPLETTGSPSAWESRMKVAVLSELKASEVHEGDLTADRLV